MHRLREILTLARWRWPAAWLLGGSVFGILAVGTPQVWVLFFSVGGIALALLSQGRGLVLGMVMVAAVAHWQTLSVDRSRFLLTLGSDWEPVEITGVVSVLTVRAGPGAVLVDTRAVNGRPVAIRVRVEGRLPPLSPGDAVRVVGSCGPIASPRNPGEYDARRSMAALGVGEQVRVYREADVEVKEDGELPWPWKIAMRLRLWIQENLAIGFEEGDETPGLMWALVLGDKQALSAEWREKFRLTGTAHLFAVSGLHVGLVAGALYWLTSLIGMRRRWWRATLTLVGAVLYCLVTGISPSSVRATIMTAVALLAVCLDRRPFSANTLFVAGTIILLLRPLDLYDAGFQLSFVVVLALLMLAPPIWRQISVRLAHDPFIPVMVLTRWQRWREKVALFMAGLGTANLAAWLGALPLSIWYFQLVSPVGLPANFLLGPLAACLLGLGLASGLLGGWLPWLGWGFNRLAGGLAALVFGIVQSASELPGGAWTVSPQELIPTPPLRVLVADVGEGAANLIQTREQTWLFDSGHARDWRWVVRPLLRWEGVRRLDGLILSHGDAAHYGGGAPLLREFSVDRLVESTSGDRSPTRRALERLVQDVGLPGEGGGDGDSWSLGAGGAISIFHPPPGWTHRHADNKTVVARVECAGGSVLFLSDLGFAGMDELRRRHPGLRAEVVVAGESPVDPIEDPQMLAWLEPKLLILGATRVFGDPEARPAWQQALAAEGLKVWDQGEHGAVTIEWTPTGWQARGFVSGAEWREPNVRGGLGESE